MSVTDREQTALDVSYPVAVAARGDPPRGRERRAALRRRRYGGAADQPRVGEAATNVIVHAYRDRPTADAGRLRLVVRASASSWLAVHVHDDGMGLIPRSDSPGLGLGLCVMAHETDRFEVRGAPGGGTEVVLRLRL